MLDTLTMAPQPPASNFDSSLEKFLYFPSDQQTDLPVLGSSALDQLLQPFSKLVSEPVLDPVMERMSPDSSMDWMGQRMPHQGYPINSSDDTASTSSGSVSSYKALGMKVQPDSTTSDVNYDSDAFNSDDSNQSFVELQLNPNLLANLTMQQQQLIRDAERESSSSGSSIGSPPPQEPSLYYNDSDNKRCLSGKRKKVKRVGAQLLKCDQCSYTTRYKEHLTSHMNTHNNDRNFMCSDCGQTFKWSHSLKRHQRTHQADFKFSCQFCHKSFSRKDHLTIHENLHRNSNESFPCQECGASFKNKKTLAGHLKTHLDEKQFKCTECESEFTRRASLNRHIRATHAGQVIPCPLCPAQFSYRSTLEDHKKAAHNEGRRDYGCPLCGVQFAVKAYLGKHMITCRNRANGKSFDCHYCGKGFPTKRHLNDHSKRKHRTPITTKETFELSSSSSPNYPEETLAPQYQHRPPPSYESHCQQNRLPSMGQSFSLQCGANQISASNPGQFSCELCHASFGTEQGLEDHLMSHFPPSNRTADEMPLSQINDNTTEDNVGSLMRLVYNCTDSQSSLPDYQDMTSHTTLPHPSQHSSHTLYQTDKVQAEALMDYPILDTLQLDCL